MNGTCLCFRKSHIGPKLGQKRANSGEERGGVYNRRIGKVNASCRTKRIILSEDDYIGLNEGVTQ